MAALVVIDMLNDFFVLNPVLAEKREQLVSAINALLEGFRQYRHPVIWVRQEFRSDLRDSFLEMRRHGTLMTIAGTDGCEILPELNRLATDTTIVKKRYSAFFGTPLDDYLASIRPDVLVMAGINTHACVRMTTIDAYQRDYETIVASECVGSYDPSHHDVTIQYLVNSGIARVLHNSEIFKVLAS
jgi:nicotinamidase-related amidase